MNNTIIEKAMAKYPKARRIAVENFTSGYEELSMEASMNLESDAAAYRWNGATTNAIRFVLREKAKLAFL